MANVDNSEDIIDSRDVIARIEELEAAEDGTDDELAELVTLRKLAEQASGYAPDWRYGTTLVRDSYFMEYAQQLAEDCSDVDFRKLAWPLTCIDWEKAARELRMDYTAVDFDGVTYWVR